MPTTASQLRVQIRWLIRRDMPEVLEIEGLCFEHAWIEDDFLACLRQRNCIGMVAEYEGYIVGAMVYELHKVRMRLLNFAVLPRMQRRGVGRQMVQRLIDKLSQQRRKQIIATVRETNLDAQLFFKAMGFLCVATLRDEYEDTTEDGYEFLYQLDPVRVDDRLSAECEGK